MKSTASKRQAILARLKRTEEAIAKCREYLQTGAHADWKGFRPLFNVKMTDGEEQLPHPDWVKNWFLPRLERALRRTEKLADRMGVDC